MGKQSRKTVKTSLHLELHRDNWENLRVYLEEYNQNPRRLTGKLQASDVVNEALLYFLREYRGDRS